MTRGQGSLFLATRTGVRMVGLALPAASSPAPTWWAHDSACAWAAAWLTVRNRQFLGARELLELPAWSGELCWSENYKFKTARHRPDLVVIVRGEPRVPIEVELAPKSKARLKAILELHHTWAMTGGTGGTIYICRDEEGCDRIHRVAHEHGLIADERGSWLRIENLDTIKAQTDTAPQRGPATQATVDA